MASGRDTLIIRRAIGRDFLPIAALDRIAWQNNRHSEFIPDGEHAWRLWVDHALVFCAEEVGRIVGAVEAHPCMTPGLWCLHKVFVDPACRGRGVGSRLFEVLLAEIDRLGVAVFLTVDPANEAAIRLYESWGFVERQFEKGYYRDHEDRYILTRPARTAHSSH